MDARQKSHILSSYYAPRGHTRMYELGVQIAQQYLSPTDKLIGIIGESGAGKSALIRGMFPGLELTNDDNGIYMRPLPLLSAGEIRGFFAPHTYHVDIRFENGFTQMTELAEAIVTALENNKRVIVEHFELVYPLLGANANLLIGVGEQVLIARPNLFGPSPEEIRKVVHESLPYRLMAHTAEDLVEMCLPPEDLVHCGHSDFKHGFSMYFEHRPSISISELEEKVNQMISAALPIAYVDDHHVSIGGTSHPCTGPRIHVSNTSQVKGFRLLHHYVYDRFHKLYYLVGCVGEHSDQILKELTIKSQRPGWE